MVRVARNGVDGAADLSGDGISVEVKRRKSLATLDAWIDQARQACAANQTPLVCCRSDRGAWICMIALDDLDAISRVLAQHRLQIMGE